jgi:hypothetical protein
MKLHFSTHKKKGLIIILIGICSIAIGFFVSWKRAIATVQAPQFLFSVNAREYLPDDYITYKIEGALPNAPITFAEWRNGQYQGTFSAGNTDANGNWTAIDWLGNYELSNIAGHIKREYTVSGVSSADEWDNVEQYHTWYCHVPSVNKCLQIAQEKRGGQSRPIIVRIPEPPNEHIPVTYDLNKVKAYYLVVERPITPGAIPSVIIHDIENDQLITYMKIKVRIMREPTTPCEICVNNSTYPSSLDPVASDELIVVVSGTASGEGLHIGNITLSQIYRGNEAWGAAHAVHLFVRNKFNPKVVAMAGGPASIYTVGILNNVPYLSVNTTGIFYVRNVQHGMHPLMSLNPVPNDPSTSDQFSISISDLQNILNQ